MKIDVQKLLAEGKTYDEIVEMVKAEKESYENSKLEKQEIEVLRDKAVKALTDYFAKSAKLTDPEDIEYLANCISDYLRFNKTSFYRW